MEFNVLYVVIFCYFIEGKVFKYFVEYGVVYVMVFEELFFKGQFDDFVIWNVYKMEVIKQ